MNQLNKQYFHTRRVHKKNFKWYGWFIWIGILLIIVVSVYREIQSQLEKKEHVEQTTVSKGIFETIWNSETFTIELERTTIDLATTISDAIEQINEIPSVFGKPYLILVSVRNDTAFLKMENDYRLTEEMGSTGANEYLAILVFTLTEFESIECVHLDFEEGSHAIPGTYSRRDFDPSNI